MLRSVKDIVDADDAGRIHTQRFLKNFNAVLGDNTWTDWAFASGQPAYDARVGSANVFTPVVAARNDAIFFPDIPTGMERRLLNVNLWTIGAGTNQTSVDCQIYDLAGYYTQIDGDNTDVQGMDNTATLPRYADGVGVMPVLVNYIAPAVAQSDMLVTYTNSDGVPGRTVTWRTTLNGVTKACYAPGTGGGTGALVCNLAPGDRGVRSIDDIQFVTAPGGLWCVYLVSLKGSMPSRANLSSQGVFTEKNFLLENSWHAPLIPDGASLGFFAMPFGGGRAFFIYGDMTFVWG